MSNTMVKRPPSEDLIDLHVFVVPIESWLGKYSVAYNNVALQSTSAGFIRVYHHATLQIIRELIEDQLETDVVPDDYVFLRSVGRCLAIVNRNQEKTLKAKHFLPPVAFSPEIFILPGTHEWIASLRKQTKSIVVNGDIAVEDEYRLGSNDFFKRETSDDYPRSDQYSEDGYVNADRQDPRGDAAPQLSNEQSPDDGNHPSEESSLEGTGDSSEMLLEGAQLKKNRRNFIDVIKAKQSNSSQGSYANSQQNYSRHLKEAKKSPSEAKKSPKNYQQRSLEENNNFSDENGKFSNRGSEVDSLKGASEEDSGINRFNGFKEPRNNDSKKDAVSMLKIRSPVAQLRNEGSSRRAVVSGGEVSSSNARNGMDDLSLLAKKEEEQRRQRSETFPRGGPAIQVLHPEIVNHQTSPVGLNRPSPLPSANVIHSTLSMDNYGRASEQKTVRPEKPAKEEKEEAVAPRVESPEDAKEPVQEADDGKAQLARTPNPEDLKRMEEERRRLEEEKRKMEEMNNDTMQMMKEMEDLLQKKKEEEERRKEEEERRKREEKERIERKKNEVAQLRDELIKIREARIEKQKHREGLMKNARDLKAKVTSKRGTGMGVWESKYQAERQRAGNLEEELGNLKSELAESQKKLLKSLEQKDSDEPNEQKSPRTIVGPSQLNNLKNEVRRLNREKDCVEDDIQKTKKKLLVESQRKAVAHQQLKELRRDKKKAPATIPSENVSSPRTKSSYAEQ